jgi:hypothetical protein
LTFGDSSLQTGKEGRKYGNKTEIIASCDQYISYKLFKQNKKLPELELHSNLHWLN